MSSSIETLTNGFLPDDLTLQILARLPLKTLFRCKTICKSWNCIIPSDPHLVNLHNEISLDNPLVLVETLQTPQSRPNLISIDRRGSVSESSLAFLNDRVKVRASCNGLLCCASVPNRGLYYVCNPFTGESKALPRTRERPFSRYHPDYEATLVGLAFDPSKRGFTVALAGFYRPFGWRPFDRLVCSVFDSETNSWRKFVSSHYDEFTHMNRNQVVFVNGRLHWLTMSCSYILTLDPIEGLWRKVSTPLEILAEKFGARVYLLEMEGKLSVVQMTEATMNVWVLEDYGIEEWRVVERVNLRCIKGFVPNAFPIGMSSGVVFLATRRTVLMYERKSKVWKEVYSGRDGFTYPLWFSAYAFKSTLSSFG
ncbi:F-box protein [Acorus calamus]|uniref:F-box protein n=1 Tax=Acorus calamus TaxID=4465 RepID=A0AAV9EYR9_ACOCL|nr:F-box protein [Acorus calamus]